MLEERKTALIDVVGTNDVARGDSLLQLDTAAKKHGKSSGGDRAESALIAASRAGDVESFEALVSSYERRLYRVLSRMLGNEADAQDVLQDSLVKAFEKIATFRAESAFGTWLHRIAINQALMWLRKKSADPMRGVDDPMRFNWIDAHLQPIEEWSASMEGGLLRAEARQVLSRALADLPEIDRAVVLLKDADGLSHEDIAAATGLTVVAARSRLHRARLVLRERLSEYFRDGRQTSPADHA